MENTTQVAPLGYTNSDWFLQILVNMINNSADAFLSITLNVGGTIVSGQLTSGDQYFSGFAADLKGAGFSAEAADEFNKLGQIYIQRREKPNEAADDDFTKNPPQYIHLKNARIFSPGSPNAIPSNRGVWWRGRLNAVDGFILGSLTQS